jgi:methylenetetrahydrofolate reductase (NADPH)
MNSYSIEIVPRNWEYLLEQFSIISKGIPKIETVNIPDLLRFEIRSWEACSKAVPFFKNVIPHLRAIDFNLKQGFELINVLQTSGLKKVLIITGDKPQDMNKKIYRNTCCEFIRVIKKECPSLKIYSSIDQYRSGIRDEIDYAMDKIEAGSDGFFTQPFFDMNFLKMYADILSNHEIYWGISPVTSIGSKMYWEGKNNVVFPTRFEPTLEWNVQFAKNVIEYLDKRNTSVYFMPIKVSISEYLTKVFSTP